MHSKTLINVVPVVAVVAVALTTTLVATRSHEARAPVRPTQAMLDQQVVTAPALQTTAMGGPSAAKTAEASTDSAR